MLSRALSLSHTMYIYERTNISVKIKVLILKKGKKKICECRSIRDHEFANGAE